MNTEIVPSIAYRYIDVVFPDEINCIGFIFLVYHEAGLSTDFRLQPRLNDPSRCREHIGKIIFLKRRNKEWPYRFSHAAIIYDVGSVIHYSRHMSPDRKWRVQITPLAEILEVYEFIPSPYVKS